MVDEERSRFEAFVVRDLRRDEGEKFMARNQRGEYVSPAARCAWAAWQARGMIDAEEATGTIGWFGNNPLHGARILREIQVKAALGISESREGSAAWIVCADIHRICASALSLKSTEPPGENNGR